MKKAPLLALIVVLTLLQTLVVAQETNTSTPYPDPAQEITNRINEVVCTLVTLGTMIASGIAALVIILAGVKYTTSAEDPGARNNAKNMILYAIAGLALALLACPLVDYIVAGTDITPFEESCNCLVLGNGNGTNGGAGGGGDGGGNDGGGTGGGNLKANGESCSSSSQCNSGSCQSGICCYINGCIHMGQCYNRAACDSGDWDNPDTTPVSTTTTTTQPQNEYECGLSESQCENADEQDTCDFLEQLGSDCRKYCHNEWGYC